MGRLDGKVAFITGAARGQGRSHAVRLAQEGADIIAADICSSVDTVPYPTASSEDLAETVRLVEAEDRRIFSGQADVRNFEALKGVLDAGVAEFGRLDIVLANAGILSFAPAHEMPEEMWAAMIDINLTGVWHTTKAATPHLLERGGGSIIITSSGAGLRGAAYLPHYCAAKHGVVGLMRSLAIELAPQMIRVNTVHPTNVDTDMIMNEAVFTAFRPDLENPGREDFVEPMTAMNAMPLPWVEPIDISNAIVFLASDEARYVSGITFPVDLGMSAK